MRRSVVETWMYKWMEEDGATENALNVLKEREQVEGGNEEEDHVNWSHIIWKQGNLLEKRMNKLKEKQNYMKRLSTIRKQENIYAYRAKEVEKE